MRFKNRAFALIWIVLSAVLCCGGFSLHEKTAAANANPVVPVSAEPINQEKISVFLMFIALLSLSMGVFFFAYSDELSEYVGNYKRSKEI